MSYILALRLLITFTEQVVPIYKLMNLTSDVITNMIKFKNFTLHLSFMKYSFIIKVTAPQ